MAGENEERSEEIIEMGDLQKEKRINRIESTERRLRAIDRY